MRGIRAALAFFYPIRGLRFLNKHRKLWLYVAVPSAINALLVVLFLALALPRLGGWIHTLFPEGGGALWDALYWILVIPAAVVLVVMAFYAFALVGNLVLAPFNDLLSERVEWICAGRRDEAPFRLGAFLRDAARALGAALGRAVLYILMFALLGLLNLLPLVGTAAFAVLSPAVAMLFLGWEYLEYSMERRRLDFRARVRLVLRNAPAVLSFGFGASLLLMVPLLNFVAIPLCVVGGTLLMCDLQPLPGPEGGTE